MPSIGRVYIGDVSGNTMLLDTSGRIQIAGSITANVSGAEVFLGSGTIVGLSGIASDISGAAVSISGQNVVVSSGAISIVSGSITVNSGQVAVSGLFAGFSGAQKFLSGAAAVSGAIPIVNLIYDFSGAQWAPISTPVSGATVPAVWLASGTVTASVSSGAVSVSSGAISIVSGSITVNSGTVSLSGLNITSSVQSGGAALGPLQSGIPGAAVFAYDKSGLVWNPIATPASGANSAIVTLGSNAASPSIVGVNFMSDAAANTNTVGLDTNALVFGFDSVMSGHKPVRVTTSGDSFRLRTSTEGRAPTYTVNATNITLFSGTAVQVAPYIALMNFGSGTAIQSGSAYKIKSLFIQPDAANTIASGQAIKWDIIRFTAFSGGGTLISGVAHDTSDPAYSGTLAGPTLMKNCGSGVTLDAVYFTYIGTTEGPYVEAAGLGGTFNTVFDPNTTQLLNLVGVRMQDTKEIVIRSGFGFGVVQSSGAGYSQLFSGSYGFSMTYSVEG